MIDINKYGNNEVQFFVYPKIYNLNVTQSDYDNGYIIRYFAKKINDAKVIEIIEDNYNQISSQLFTKIMIKWNLTGILRNSYVNGKLYERGIYEKNLEELNTAAKTMPELKNFITNYTQYSKPRKN